MKIETERLILRNFDIEEAKIMLEIINDPQVKKYHPTFFENANIDFIEKAILYFRKNEEQSMMNPEHGFMSAVYLKEIKEVIGLILLCRKKEPPYEWHIGWYFLSKHTMRGYASEAGSVASDYFLDYLSLDYISAGVHIDNPASFKTALKSGFKLIEKRIPFNGENNCNINYFSNINDEIENGNYYYFQKLNIKLLDE